MRTLERLKSPDRPPTASPVGKISAMSVVRQLGPLDLYKGSSACLLRDVPFSAIYFPTYAYSKDLIFSEGGTGQSPLKLFAAGCIAGVPAAYLVTPADVIKTRIQVSTRLRNGEYTGLFQTARKILSEEGITAFLKGGGARIMRSAPQFGVTLCVFDILKH